MASFSLSLYDNHINNMKTINYVFINFLINNFVKISIKIKTLLSCPRVSDLSIPNRQLHIPFKRYVNQLEMGNDDERDFVCLAVVTHITNEFISKRRVIPVFGLIQNENFLFLSTTDQLMHTGSQCEPCFLTTR